MVNEIFVFYKKKQRPKNGQEEDSWTKKAKIQKELGRDDPEERENENWRGQHRIVSWDIVIFSENTASAYTTQRRARIYSTSNAPDEKSLNEAVTSDDQAHDGANV